MNTLPPELVQEINQEHIEFSIRTEKMNSVGMNIFSIFIGLILLPFGLFFLLANLIIPTVIFFGFSVMMTYAGVSNLLMKKPVYIIGTTKHLIFFKKKANSYPWNKFEILTELKRNVIVLKSHEGFPPQIPIFGAEDPAAIQKICERLIKGSS